MQPVSNGTNSAEAAPAFLTEAQRAALDAALAAKARSKGAENGVAKHAPHHDSRATRKHGIVHVRHTHGKSDDRKPKTTKSTDTKKRGAGGKFTWGAMLADAIAEPAAYDRGDPNYDSDNDAVLREVTIGGDATAGADWDGELEDGREEEEDDMERTHSRIVLAVQQLKAEIMAMLQEYLESGDIDEAAACVAESQLPQYDYYVVKRSLTLAMDRGAREREAISVLLSSLYGRCLSPAQMQKGFVAVLEDFDDLLLDVPDAVHIMSLFICRAVTDEVLPPSFVSRILPPPRSPLEALKHACQAELGQPHCAERMLRCWGSDAKLEFQPARERVRVMLDEYLVSRDVGELERCLRALSAPFLHHEVVKQAVLIALSDPAAAQEPMLALLAALAETDELSSLQRAKGFQRVADQIGDLALDVPNARAAFCAFRDAAVARGVLEGADAARLDASLAGEGDAAAGGGGGEVEHARSVAEFKRDVTETLAEYYNSADADEVARRLANADELGMLHIFVKAALVTAMGRGARERELTSSLLAALVPAAVPAAQLAVGVTRLLAAADDLVLDVPDAPRLASLFLARLVVDEVAPPAFLTQVLGPLRPGSLAVEVVRATGRLLSAPHAAERVLQCWKGGYQTPAQMKASFGELVREHVEAADVAEAARCLGELNAPFYHHELVRQAVRVALDRPAAVGSVTGLLRHLAEAGAVTQTQLAKGFQRVLDDMDDLKLDNPSAPGIVAKMLDDGRVHGWFERGTSA